MGCMNLTLNTLDLSPAANARQTFFALGFKVLENRPLFLQQMNGEEFQAAVADWSLISMERDSRDSGLPEPGLSADAKSRAVEGHVRRLTNK